jgi:hypothetical protein
MNILWMRTSDHLTVQDQRKSAFGRAFLRPPDRSHRTRRRGFVSCTTREAPALCGEAAGKRLRFAVDLSHPVLLTHCTR